MAPPISDGALTTTQAADLLGMSREGVAQLVDRGELRGFRVGTHRRIRREDLDAFVRARRGTAPPITLDEVRARRRRILAAAKRRGFTDVLVFGSVARGTARPGSDVDLIVIPTRKVGLFGLAGLSLDLEEILGRPVDVLTRKTVEMNPHMADALADAVPL
jgi:excisionase family DNA binding protein